MESVTLRRSTTLIAGAAGAAVLSAGVAWACVPQRGTLEAEVTSSDDAGNVGTEVDTAVKDVVVGDGDSGTKHHNSWCGDHGGHPISALYAANGDEITVTVGPAEKGEIDADDPCPANDSQLDEGTNYVWVENGIKNDKEDVYEWVTDAEGNEPNFDYSPHGGFWAFLDSETDDDGIGDGVGCYKSGAGADPEQQGTFQVAADGTGSTSFNLSLPSKANGGNTNNDDGDKDGEVGEHASVLCVGDDIDETSPRAIFAPLSVTEI